MFVLQKLIWHSLLYLHRRMAKIESIFAILSKGTGKVTTTIKVFIIWCQSFSMTIKFLWIWICNFLKIELQKQALLELSIALVNNSLTNFQWTNSRYEPSSERRRRAVHGRRWNAYKRWASYTFYDLIYDIVVQTTD